MEIKNNYKFFSFILIFLSLFSFFFGFYLDENSAGAGSYEGDIQTIWKNLQIFLSNAYIMLKYRDHDQKLKYHRYNINQAQPK